MDVIDIANKMELLTEQWTPKIIAQMNDYHFKIAKIQGEFIWHSHSETDEVFIVIDGSLRIQFRNGDAQLEAGQMCVVPKGLEHKPIAEQECQLMLVEPAGTANTGDAGGERTAPAEQWI